MVAEESFVVVVRGVTVRGVTVRVMRFERGVKLDESPAREMELAPFFCKRRDTRFESEEGGKM